MSNEKKAPSYQHYPDKTLTDTKRLSWAAKGIYRELKDFIWMQFQDTCSVPDDDEYIAKELGCTLQEWGEARKEIMCKHRPLFESQGDRLVSLDLLREKKKQAEHRQKMSEAGKLGNEKRWGLDFKEENIAEPSLGDVKDIAIDRSSSPSPTVVKILNPPTPHSGGGVDGEESQKSKRKPKPRLEVPTERESRIFARWQEVCKRQGATFDDKRIKAVRRMLDFGKTDQQCFDAIDGVEHSPHHQGKNEQGKIYDDIELIFRDAKHFEDFERLGRIAREEKERGERRQVAEKAKLEKERAEQEAKIAQWESEKQTGPPISIPSLISNLSNKFSIPRNEGGTDDL